MRPYGRTNFGWDQVLDYLLDKVSKAFGYHIFMNDCSRAPARHPVATDKSRYGTGLGLSSAPATRKADTNGMPEKTVESLDVGAILPASNAFDSDGSKPSPWKGKPRRIYDPNSINNAAGSILGVTRIWTKNNESAA